jgi:hypothetical protein
MNRVVHNISINVYNKLIFKNPFDFIGYISKKIDFNDYKMVELGRWCMTDDTKIIEKKMDLANYDNCYSSSIRK